MQEQQPGVEQAALQAPCQTNRLRRVEVQELVEVLVPPLTPFITREQRLVALERHLPRPPQQPSTAESWAGRTLHHTHRSTQSLPVSTATSLRPFPTAVRALLSQRVTA